MSRVLKPCVVFSLGVTEGHHGRYWQVTLKVAPVGDPRDCHGITLAPNYKTHKSERKALLLFLPVLNSELPKRGMYLGVDGGTLKKPKCLWGHYKHEPECVLTGAQNH